MGYEWQKTANGRKYVRTTDAKPKVAVKVKKAAKPKATDE